MAATHNAADSRVVAALARIKSGDCRTLSPANIAKSVNLSKSRLRHLVKTQTGLSMQDLIRQRRLQLGRALVGQSFLSVKEIAVTVGMDVSHFVTMFKRHFGVTPGTLRRKPSAARNASWIGESANE